MRGIAKYLQLTVGKEIIINFVIQCSGTQSIVFTACLCTPGMELRFYTNILL